MDGLTMIDTPLRSYGIFPLDQYPYTVWYLMPSISAASASVTNDSLLTCFTSFSDYFCKNLNFSLSIHYTTKVTLT